MESVTLSELEAACPALLERVKKTGQPLLITKAGKPLAQVVPPPLSAEMRDPATAGRELLELMTVDGGRSKGRRWQREDADEGR